jgi:hypothetical protein
MTYYRPPKPSLQDIRVSIELNREGKDCPVPFDLVVEDIEKRLFTPRLEIEECIRDFEKYGGLEISKNENEEFVDFTKSNKKQFKLIDTWLSSSSLETCSP